MNAIEELEQSIKDTLHSYDSDLSERLAPIVASIIATAYSEGYKAGTNQANIHKRNEIDAAWRMREEQTNDA
tara:strand:+ start:190 stop:405 length:216 start_codon:yes stop_codon:yes gene_type:complete